MSAHHVLAVRRKQLSRVHLYRNRHGRVDSRWISELYRRRGDIEIVQRVSVGHGDLKATTVYLHLSQRHLRAIQSPLDAQLRSVNTWGSVCCGTNSYTRRSMRCAFGNWRAAAG
jgi:hypothetical protein